MNIIRLIKNIENSSWSYWIVMKIAFLLCKHCEKVRKTNNDIERFMNDYHSLLWNLVFFVRYMQMKAQTVCECQNVNFNWSIHTIEFWLQHLSNTFAKIVFSTFFHNNRLCFLLNILSNSIWNFRANFLNDVYFETFVQILSKRRVFELFQSDEFSNFFNDAYFRVFSTMYCLKLSNKLFQWRKFWRINSYIDAKIAKTNESTFVISNMT